MIAEWGFFALILAFLFALALTIVPSIYLALNSTEHASKTALRLAKRYGLAQFFFIACAYLCLTILFLKDDFSVIYVIANSSRSLPWIYKACAVWGGHEGSMLLWVAILTAWMLGVSYLGSALSEVMRVRMLIVLGAISIGFLLFLIMTSNPFIRQFQDLESTGRSLNPLLQDIGFLFHPPMLYMGYVGFSVPFAFAIAWLWQGEIASKEVRWVRPWTLGAWCCLTLGITLGSWWAYRELGWGGWWFWDPVENASFMPWLIGTALIHCLMMCDKRQRFQNWAILLAIIAFSLSLIGTFLVRSGVLSSVHAFAVDPARGLYILLFLGVVVGGALCLFAFKAPHRPNLPVGAVFSRENLLLLNNILLMVMMATVLLGTVYPLLIDGLGLGKLSVGAPYFNRVFVPLFIPLLWFMALGIHALWQGNSKGHSAARLKTLQFSLKLVAISVPLGLCLIAVYKTPTFTAVTVGVVSGFAVLSSLAISFYQRLIQHKGISLSYLGMFLAHLGIAITVLGIAISSGFGIQKDVKMAPGDRMLLNNFVIQCIQEKETIGPNYHGIQMQFRITHHGKVVEIYPEKRIYEVGEMVMTEAKISASLFYDLYIALGEPLSAEAWAVRIYYKPLVRWIWAGGFFMLIGGGLSMLDKRYRRVNA